MTQEEYKVAAMRQVFGGVLKDLTWFNLNDEYPSREQPLHALGRAPGC